MNQQPLTLNQFIASARAIIDDRTMTDNEVLETVENCIEETIGWDSLDTHLTEFKRCYASWLEYQHEMAQDYASMYG